MYRIAPDRARFISPNIVYALKEQSPGVQAADLLAYPVYVLERDGRAEVRDLDEGFPDSLPLEEVESFRSPIPFAHKAQDAYRSKGGATRVTPSSTTPWS